MPDDAFVGVHEPLLSPQRQRVKMLLQQFVATVDAEQLPMGDVLDELAMVAGVGLGLAGGRGEQPREVFLATLARWFERVADVAVRRYVKTYHPKPRPFRATAPGRSLLN